MSVYKRASGKWLVLIDVDRTETGKRIRKSLGTFSTKKEADRAEREALSARDRGVDLAPRTVKVEAVLNHYLAEREAHCGAKTLERYRELATRNILPTLGSRYVVKLKPAHIAEWLTGLRRSGGMKGKPLSAKTVRHAFGLLQGALRWAIRMQIVDRNICETVQPPSVPKSEAKALTHVEITNLLQAAAGTRWECFVMLALSTGARRGELCALIWSDIDVETATLTISKSLSQTRSGTAVKCTKSGKSRRIPLSPFALDAIERHRSAYVSGAGEEVIAECPLFTDELGNHITPMTASCAFDRLARKAKLSTTRLHDTRHTAATALLSSGVDIRTVSSIIGHANASTTLNIYSHVIPDVQQAAVGALGSRLQRAFEGTREKRGQPNGNRQAPGDEKTPQPRHKIGSANGNRIGIFRSVPVGLHRRKPSLSDFFSPLTIGRRGP